MVTNLDFEAVVTETKHSFFNQRMIEFVDKL